MKQSSLKEQMACVTVMQKQQPHTQKQHSKSGCTGENKHGKAKQEVIHTNPTPSKQITRLNNDKFMQSETNTRSKTPLP